MRTTVEARLPGLVLGALGIGFCVGGQRYGVVHDGRMGPGLMPLLAGLALVGLGAALAVAGVAPVAAAGRSPSPSPDGSPSPGAAGGDAAADRAARPWVVFGSVVAVLLATAFIGLLLALGAMSFALMLLVERLRVWVAAAATLAILVLSWLIFIRLLAVPLPVGVLLGG
ncbi:tripartite tricarboxylate transporter TctB family protein [Jiangella asiatica]|uniref:DUF1468 domain-containing protein n=1 Tax=Jiangella asiatica TaxID=2530372 RepID=A0A4R5DDD9_9ACTN|nr:tripartite tricarboxylate transporter TctB family protein [Jiangella asiatica]TDE11816.1 hypothetical protein E1269_08615 [Jiangella asiatica]